MENKVRLTVRMTADVKRDAERVAAALGVSVNTVVLLALRDYITRHDKKKAGDSIAGS